MAHTPRAPKQWCLSKVETVNSFENWKQNLIYTLTLDENFAPFLVEGFVWEKKTKATPKRGFRNDNEDVPMAKRRTADQKVNMLELLLGQIANYCPIIARNSIVKNSTSIQQIWQQIRLHYGFQSTGGHFLDFCDIALEPNERPEDLFQRITAFTEDNLLRANGSIQHHSQDITEDEELTPSLENFIVLTWLRLIHPDLPKFIKQRYGTELRTRTLASIKPEISQALDSLLFEIQTSDNARAFRANIRDTKPKPQTDTYPTRQRPRAQKVCPLCKQTKRVDFNHFLSMCPYLPDTDRKYMAKARQISDIFEEEDDAYNTYASGSGNYPSEASALLVQVRQSPYLDVFYDHHVARITVDSGATGNMMQEATAMRFGVPTTKSSQSARQADGSSPLTVVGEVRLTFTRDEKQFLFEGLVVKNLDVEILAGTPFMEVNDISVRPAKRQVIIGDTITYEYGSISQQAYEHKVRRAHVLRAPDHPTTIWPGEYIELHIPDELKNEEQLALEPCPDSQNTDTDTIWPAPDLISSVNGAIRICNTTSTPQLLKKYQHFCQVQPVFVSTPKSSSKSSDSLVPGQYPNNTKITKSNSYFSDSVRINPDKILPYADSIRFQELTHQYDNVFDPNYSGYNGASGPFKAVVNMGPVQPPQRKGRVPQYSRDKLSELQNKFNELEERGVFARPEDVGINVEYVNPSFLVKKPNGGFRLVTAFADVGRYSKPQPSLMPDVDSILRQIAQWKYIISTDLTNAFFQIPLSKDSMKYCGVSTPYRGVRVYCRSAMGMPGSETALEELMCRVLGDLLEEGCVTKLADDLYCGGNTIESLLHNWERLLKSLAKNDLRLSASKTTICPSHTTILGWIWKDGTIQASPHRIATLSSCHLPESVKGLRSFIGAYKVLARVLPNCSSLVNPLDELTAGQQSSDKVKWTDQDVEAFHQAQQGLQQHKSIVLPRPDDLLWIVTDGAVKSHGIGATLYVSRNKKTHLAGFFSAKLRGRQPTWIPCEVEALSIATATKHFSPYIIQSCHTTRILTDSKPCLQAFEKLCRGEFSVSPRVSTFLSIVSRYQISIHHLSGKANLPSDFSSRNAPECHTPVCQICSFIRTSEETVVRKFTTDVTSPKVPYTNRAAWIDIQNECPDLRRTHAHLKQGTRPSKKITNIKDVKRYLNVVTIAKDGLMVVRHTDALEPPRECIVVPRSVIDGLLTSLHLQLDHPSKYQLNQVFKRHFYALDTDKIIQRVNQSCHQCTSLQKTPHTLIEQSTNDPPEVVGISFAADIMKRERQLILVLRETVTAFTVSTFVDSESASSVRENLIKLCIELCPLDGPNAVIRTDPAPAFQALVNDKLLLHHRISIEIGRIKNHNKNPVAEKAIQELQGEILRQQPTGGSITSLVLALATARLNTRIRSSGLSARELWTQRDQFSAHQIPVTDRDLILKQHLNRNTNHQYSERSKTPSSKVVSPPSVTVGDIVYLFSDGSKLYARHRYLVTSVDGKWCNVRKFSGHQLRKTSYRVKLTECYKIKDSTTKIVCSDEDTSSDEDSTSFKTTRHLSESVTEVPDVPEIPTVLTDPIDQPPMSTCVDQSPIPEADDIHPDQNIHPESSRPKRSRHLPKRFDDFELNF